MTGDISHREPSLTPAATPTEQRCANCGAALAGPFCGQCGQSSRELERPFLGLITDTLDGLLSWDGRLLVTLRALYARPGHVTRDYLDGRRARYTPPVRLYALVSVIFFFAMSVSGIQAIGVAINAGPDAIAQAAGSGLDSQLREDERAFAGVGLDEALVINLELFRPPWTPGPQPVDPETLAALESTGRASGPILRLLEDPVQAEQAASTAAAQAIVIMVAVFSLLGLLLHPRARLITHIVNSLYFHAAILPPVAVTIALGLGLGMLSQTASVTLLGLSLAGTTLFIALQDRQVYRSSWIGASLRALLMLFIYLLCLIALAGVLVMVGVR